MVSVGDLEPAKDMKGMAEDQYMEPEPAAESDSDGQSSAASFNMAKINAVVALLQKSKNKSLPITQASKNERAIPDKACFASCKWYFFISKSAQQLHSTLNVLS